jgi:hypothetical protein
LCSLYPEKQKTQPPQGCTFLKLSLFSFFHHFPLAALFLTLVPIENLTLVKWKLICIPLYFSMLSPKTSLELLYDPQILSVRIF